MVLSTATVLSRYSPRSSGTPPMPPVTSQLADLSVGDAAPVRVMGVLNVSPESFYSGSVRTRLDRLVQAAEQQVSEGADIIDLGAMSTAPYLKTHISEAEETDRLAPAIEALAARLDVPVSADTKRAGVARAALAAGAGLINDVSGLKHDPAMAGCVAEAGVGVILMASEPSPGRGSPLGRIHTALKRQPGSCPAGRYPYQPHCARSGHRFFSSASNRLARVGLYGAARARRFALVRPAATGRRLAQVVHR